MNLLEQMAQPLLRLLLGISFGLLLATLLESLGWAQKLGKLASPLSRTAHLGPDAASSFALSFISPHAANALLSEKYRAGTLSGQQLVLANLFNGLPAYFAHTPTIFLLLWPVLGLAALTYAGITFISALLRTFFIVVLGRKLLPLPPSAPEVVQKKNQSGLRPLLATAWKRFCQRLPKLLLFTIPIYILMFACQKWGIFGAIEMWMSQHLDWLSFLKPQAMGIIVLQFLAEFGASLGAASAALTDGGLTPQDIVIALLVGNVLATPLRAIRHQLPSYMGFYPPAMAIKLVLANQSLRAASMMASIALYLAL